ncbi:hypothetical protein GUJ93_ZPchr0008g13586 [Zizania palustris]|uniref:Uncharacterized protein n=1 Tax=Zizania palustris TaxID=103762 RepID=A0A8J5RE29_ZIZPA|nr:hypothetical protein GUJ93_ZPchr0008g13586 [Zizania palustris]
MLCVLLEKYNQIEITIEMLLDVNTMSIEELVGQLHVADDKYGIKEVVDDIRKVLLTEEQWETCKRQRHGKQHACKDGIKNGSEKPRVGFGVL